MRRRGRDSRYQRSRSGLVRAAARTPRPTTAPAPQSPDRHIATCSDSSAGSLLQAPVNGLDKRVAGDECARRAVERIVITRRLRPFYLFERHVLLDHVLD